MRGAGIIACVAGLGLAACDLPSPAGPSAEELAAQEAALEQGATDVEAAQAADEARKASNPFAALFRPRQDADTDSPEAEDVPPSDAGDDAESDGASSAPQGFFASLFQPKAADDGAQASEGGVYYRYPLRAARMTVAGPPGYCIDPDSVTDTNEGSFAILASCNILSDGEEGAPVEAALMTVSVGRPGSGRQVPASSEIAASMGAAMIGGKDLGTFAVAHLQTGGKDLLENGDERHWRAAFSYRNRLVGLALYAPAGSPLAFSESGADLLAKLREAIETASSR